MSINLQTKDFFKKEMNIHTFFCFQDHKKNYHSHEFWELIFVYDGEGIHYTTNTSDAISAGDVLIVKPGTVHDLVANDGKELYVCNCLVTCELLNKILASILPIVQENSFELYELLTNNKDFSYQFHLSDSDCIKYMFWTIIHEYNHYTVLSMNLIHLTLQSLMLSLMRIYEYSANRISAAITNNSDIDDVITYLQMNYRSEITLAILSKEFHLSREYLCRYFKRVTGKTILEFLSEIRITHAKSLLLTTQYPISDIGATCGFPTPGNFYKVFKKHMGMSPREFREKRRNT